MEEAEQAPAPVQEQHYNRVMAEVEQEEQAPPVFMFRLL